MSDYSPIPVSDLFPCDHVRLSIEIFPPKTEEGVANLKERLRHFQEFDPSYISVTYGAGGGTRKNTLELSRYIQSELQITAVTHLTCVGHSREELAVIGERIDQSGIRNVMALRGDPPKGESKFVPPKDGLAHANELIALFKERWDFCLGCAGYPEGHVESPGLSSDLDYLKMKVDAGASYIVSQFFLDNVYFYRFRDRARKKGIKVPILAGLLPISNYEKQLTRFALMCGCTIPAKVMRGLHGKSEEDQEKYGLEHAAEQIEDLMRHDPDGIHLYALNKRKTVETLAPLIISQREKQRSG